MCQVAEGIKLTARCKGLAEYLAQGSRRSPIVTVCRTWAVIIIRSVSSHLQSGLTAAQASTREVRLWATSSSETGQAHRDLVGVERNRNEISTA